MENKGCSITMTTSPQTPLFLTMTKSSEVYMRMMTKKKPTYDMSEATLKRMTFLKKKNKKEFGLEPKRPYHKDWPMTQRQRRQRPNYPRNTKNTKQSSKRKCYGTASCFIPSHLINHASPILSNKLSNTSVWLCYETALQPLILSL